MTSAVSAEVLHRSEQSRRGKCDAKPRIRLPCRSSSLQRNSRDARIPVQMMIQQASQDQSTAENVLFDTTVDQAGQRTADDPAVNNVSVLKFQSMDGSFKISGISTI